MTKVKAPEIKDLFLGEMKLVFSPRAFSKIMYFRHAGPTEVSGQGISLTNNSLYIDDFRLVKQECTSSTTDYDDEGWTNFLQEMWEKRGLRPFQVNNVYVHTHPGFSTRPSPVDEDNWKNRIKDRTFFVMVIVSDTLESVYARMMIKEPVQVIMEIPVAIDWSGAVPNETEEELKAHYDEMVSKKTYGTSWNRATSAWNKFQGKKNKGWQQHNRSAYGNTATTKAEEAEVVEVLTHGYHGIYCTDDDDNDTPSNGVLSEEAAKAEAERLQEEAKKTAARYEEVVRKTEVEKNEKGAKAGKKEEANSGDEKKVNFPSLVKAETTIQGVAKVKDKKETEAANMLHGECSKCKATLKKNLLHNNLCQKCAKPPAYKMDPRFNKFNVSLN